MSKVNLKNYICSVPFGNLEMQRYDRHLCCSSWMPKFLPANVSAKEAWESKEANDIRNSILDGSYKYCDRVQCPFLKELLQRGDARGNRGIFHTSKLPAHTIKSIQSFKQGKIIPPRSIIFSFDRTCNLKCPSCRIDLIVENSSGIERVKKTIQEIEDDYGNGVGALYITGSGDPFVSVGFRDFLRNFNPDKWPVLDKIHLHTNATKWDKKMWDSMKNIHPYVKSCEISIDAGNKFTYENVTRIGGNWDELLENLKFINTIPTIDDIVVSFVVQKHNYKEMSLFYDLMYSIFGKKAHVFYGKINNWGTFSEDEYLKHKIWDESHPEYEDFVKEVNSFILKDRVWHNLQEFVNPLKNII